MATGGNLPPSPEKSSIASNSSASSTYTLPNLESFCALSGSQGSELDLCEQPLLSSQKSIKSDESSSASGADMASIGVPTEADLTLNFSPTEPFHLWKKVSSCEEFVGARRSKHTIVVWNDRIYVFGGDDGRRMLNDFLVSHIRDSSWARVVYTGVYVCVCVLPRPYLNMYSVLGMLCDMETIVTVCFVDARTCTQCKTTCIPACAYFHVFNSCKLTTSFWNLSLLQTPVPLFLIITGHCLVSTLAYTSIIII